MLSHFPAALILVDRLFGNACIGRFSLLLPRLLEVSRRMGRAGAKGSPPRGFSYPGLPPLAWAGASLLIWDSPSALPGEPAQEEDADQQENAAGHCQQRSSSAEVRLGWVAEQAEEVPACCSPCRVPHPPSPPAPQQEFPAEVGAPVSAFPSQNTGCSALPGQDQGRGLGLGRCGRKRAGACPQWLCLFLGAGN